MLLGAADMTKRVATFILLLGACSTEAPADLVPEQPASGKADGSCPIINAGIRPTAPPPHSCGPVDGANNKLMADVNRFWSSQVGVCACGPDFPAGCDGAFSLFTHGWVYVGLDFVNELATSSGSTMPAAYVYAHEFGHEIQGHFNAYAPTTQQRELSADCLAGYYLGSLDCRNLVTKDDIRTTLATACIIADGSGDPIADLETHGTCDQRMKAVAVGMSAYLTGQPALASCAL